MLLVVGAILAGSILVALGAARVGVPSLVAFLALGMLLGSDGPGGIEFDDAELARTVGVVGLAAILFEGGLSTSWRRLRRVAVPATLLATVGVVASTLLTGAAAYYLFDLSWLESVLLGAVVASTDAAAVFATLRFTHIRRRLARTLEAETGLNDPWRSRSRSASSRGSRSPTSAFPDLVVSVVEQLGIGLVIGVGLAAVALWSSRGSRARSGLSLPWPRWLPERCRSESPTSPAAVASSRCTSSVLRSAARRHDIAGSWSRSTRDSRSSPR